MAIGRGNANTATRTFYTKIRGSATCGGTEENVPILALRAAVLSPSNGH